MTIEDIYRKLKEKNSDYVVTEDQWGLAFTIYYKVATPVKYVRELKQAEDVGDWDKVVSLSDAIQESGHNGKTADEINVAIKRGMHIG